MLKNFYRLLKEGGKIVIDTINGQNISSAGFLEKVVLRKEKDTLSITKKLLDDLEIQYRMDIDRASNHSHTLFKIQYYTSHEILKMMEEVGFNEIKMYEDFEGSTLKEYSKKMIIIAKK